MTASREDVNLHCNQQTKKMIVGTGEGVKDNTSGTTASTDMASIATTAIASSTAAVGAANTVTTPSGSDPSPAQVQELVDNNTTTADMEMDTDLVNNADANAATNTVRQLYEPHMHITVQEITYANFDDFLENISKLHIEDNDEQLFASKYKARTMLNDARAFLVNRTAAATQDINDTNHINNQGIVDNECLIAVLDYWIGINLIDTEERGEGERLLYKVIPLLEKRNTVYAKEVIDISNSLANLWHERAQYEESKKWLIRSQQMYFKAVEFYRSNKLTNQSSLEPLDIADMSKLSLNETASKKYTLSFISIEKLHTITLLQLATVYGKLEVPYFSAKYSFLTLNRHLTVSSAYDHNEWARHAMGLAIFFSNTKNYSQAHHCLQAAELVVKRGFGDQNMNGAKVNSYENSVQDDSEKTEMITAELNRAWGNFYLSLLEASRTRLSDDQSGSEMADVEKDQSVLNTNEPGQESEGVAKLDHELLKTEVHLYLQKAAVDKSRAITVDNDVGKVLINEDVNSLRFLSLNLEDPPSCELAMSLTAATVFFKKALQKFQECTKYFLLDGHVTENIPLIQAQSECWALLSAYQVDPSTITKMHKRRLDLLEPLLKDLNARHYTNLYQQLCNECAQICMEMATIKESSKSNITSEVQSKINSLLIKAVQYHKLWLNTFDKSTAAETTKSLSEADPIVKQAYLTTLFHLARAYGKLYSTDVRALCFTLQESLKYYELTVQRTEELQAREIFSAEFAISKEMIKLLPLKMNQIMTRGAFRV